MKLLHLFFLFVLFAGALAAQGQVHKLVEGVVTKQTLPKDVDSFISRYEQCNHWGGEAPYNKDRANQINRAVKRLKCIQLPENERKLLRKYKNNPKILKVIKAAKKSYF